MCGCSVLVAVRLGLLLLCSGSPPLPSGCSGLIAASVGLRGSVCWLVIFLLSFLAIFTMAQISPIVINITLDGSNYPEWSFVLKLL